MARTVEIAILSGANRAGRPDPHYKEGDIMEMRRPLGRLGRLEAAWWVWIVASVADEVVPGAQYDAQDQLIRKGRNNIPLGSLNQVNPQFDISRARDPNDVYQPFLQLTQEPDGSYTFAPTEIVNMHGRIFDKQRGQPI